MLPPLRPSRPSTTSLLSVVVAVVQLALVAPLAPAQAQQMQTEVGSGGGVLATYAMSATLQVRSGWSGLTPVFTARLVSFDGVQLFDGTRVRASDMPADVRQQTVKLDQSPGFKLRVKYGIYDNGNLIREYRSNAAGTGSKPPWTAVVGSTDGVPGLTPVERAATKGRKMFSDGRFSIRIHSIEYVHAWDDTPVRTWLRNRASTAAAPAQASGNPLQSSGTPARSSSGTTGARSSGTASRSSGTATSSTTSGSPRRDPQADAIARRQRELDAATDEINRRGDQATAELPGLITSWLGDRAESRRREEERKRRIAQEEANRRAAAAAAAEQARAARREAARRDPRRRGPCAPSLANTVGTIRFKEKITGTLTYLDCRTANDGASTDSYRLVIEKPGRYGLLVTAEWDYTASILVYSDRGLVAVNNFLLMHHFEAGEYVVTVMPNTRSGDVDGEYTLLADQGMSDLGILLNYPAKDVVRETLGYGQAGQAGIRKGDRIVTIDGVPVADLDWSAIYDLMRGVEGTSVRLSVAKRGKGEPKEYVLQRATLGLARIRFFTLVGNDVNDTTARRYATHFDRATTSNVWMEAVVGTLGDRNEAVSFPCWFNESNEWRQEQRLRRGQKRHTSVRQLLSGAPGSLPSGIHRVACWYDTSSPGSEYFTIED